VIEPGVKKSGIVSTSELFFTKPGEGRKTKHRAKQGFSYVIVRTYFSDHRYHCRLLRLRRYRWNRSLDSAGAFRDLLGPFRAILLFPKNASNRLTLCDRGQQEQHKLPAGMVQAGSRISTSALLTHSSNAVQDACATLLMPQSCVADQRSVRQAGYLCYLGLPAGALSRSLGSATCHQPDDQIREMGAKSEDNMDRWLWDFLEQSGDARSAPAK
jgi:hypothetical protein